jgi:hypothetical protein
MVCILGGMKRAACTPEGGRAARKEVKMFIHKEPKENFVTKNDCVRSTTSSQGSICKEKAHLDKYLQSKSAPIHNVI